MKHSQQFTTTIMFKYNANVIFMRLSKVKNDMTHQSLLSLSQQQLLDFLGNNFMFFIIPPFKIACNIYNSIYPYLAQISSILYK